MGVAYGVVFVLVFFACVALEWFLDNILWIGGILIILLIRSIAKDIGWIKEFGFDSSDGLLIAFKVVQIVILGGLMFEFGL